MSKKITAAETIEALANQYRAMVEAADMLKQIGSLENAVVEAKKAIEAAAVERDAAQAEVAQAKADAKKAKEKTAEFYASINATADEIRAKAAADVEQMIAAAEVRADGIVAQAQQEAAAAMSGLADKKARLAKDVETLVAQVDQKSAELVARSVEVADLEKRLEKAQAQIAKLLG